MRKGLIAFFISIFFLSGLMGFGVVSKVRAISDNQSGRVAPANQINLILVRVDDLTLNQPRLTSIWGIFISRSVFPALVLKRIYPEAGSPISAKLAETFSLDGQKQFDPKFLDIMRALDMPAAEIVLVDHVGMSDFKKALSTQIQAGSSNELQEANQPNTAPINDLDFFQKLCATIEVPTNTVSFFSSSLPQVDNSAGASISSGYLNKWKGLVTSLHFASCEVLAGP